MAAVLWLLIYLMGGVMILRYLLPRQSPIIRLWLGASLGLFLMMWLPALLASLRPFDAPAQWLSLLLLAVICLFTWRLGDKSAPAAWTHQDKPRLLLVLLLALPLTLLSAYLLHTHVLRPEEGALYTGQSTYGDLPLHLAIITSLPGQKLPVDYSILPGVRLGYPFLANSLSSSLFILGLPLRLAILLPSVLMMALVYTGYVLLALRSCKRQKAAALAILLVFLNGGLGFLYAFDMRGVSLGSPGSNQLQLGQWRERIDNILQGWYQTPPNHAEFFTYNLRWSNLIADMLLPQRTFLAGWSILLPCLYLLFDQIKEERWNARQTGLLGVLAGGLPLIHTHSFLALALLSLGLMLYGLLRKKPFRPWLMYAGLAGLLALPQLMVFTFSQSAGEGFLRFQFNWVNNPGGSGLLDGYLWFYIKNIGLPFLLLIFTLFERDPWHRRLFSGAFVIFVAAELILFQPNEYDNNKLFYVWWAVCAMPVADYALSLHERMKGLRARPLMVALAAVLMFASGLLSIARETVSSYQMFSPEDVQLADYLRDETPRDSRFLTGTQHINPVSSLAGRQIVCGPSLWLHFHGFDTETRQEDLTHFYQNPEAHRDVPLKYGADYIVLGPFERLLGEQEEQLDQLYHLIYQNDSYRVYQVPEG